MVERSETKIGKILDSNFDSRMEGAVLSYILEKGTDYLKQISEEDIVMMKSDCNIITDSLTQSLVRTAVVIANECNTTEILTYIRCYAAINPFLVGVNIEPKDTTKEELLEYLRDKLNIEKEETIEYIANKNK